MQSFSEITLVVFRNHSKTIPGVIQDMDSLMGEHFYRSMKGIPKCIFFSKKDEDPPEMLKVLSNQFGNAILFGYVRPQHTRVQKKFGIREEKQEAELPQLVVYPHTSPGRAFVNDSAG